METYLVPLINGLVIGASLALVAAGLALLFGVMDVLNFAQGDFFMLGGYAVWLAAQHGQSFWVGALAGIVVIGGLGGLVLMALLWPLRRRAHVLMLLATIAISLIIEQMASNVFGAATQSVAPPIGTRVMIGTTDYPVYYFCVVVAAAVILFGGFAFLKWGKYGIWIRAVAQNQRMAGVLGVPVNRVYTLALVISTALAAIAGSLLAPLTSVSPTLGQDVNLDAFIVVIAGGLGNFRGAAAIALCLGIVESLGSIWIRGEAVRILVFALVIVLVIVRARYKRGAVRV